MANETAAVGKVRLYLEAKGLIDRDTFSKVKIVSRSRCPALNNQKKQVNNTRRSVRPRGVGFHQEQPQAACKLRQNRPDRNAKEQLEPEMEEILRNRLVFRE
jgi:hypothetical protein